MKPVARWIAAALVALAIVVASCGTLKQTARTIVDVARFLCEIAASEQPPELLKGQEPAAFCASEENLRPFVDEVLAAKQAASGKAGFPAE